MKGAVVAVIAGLFSASCSVFGIRTTEEPKYTVERQIGDVELRQYGPRVAADTYVGGSEISARSEGFQILAGYIFGGNAAKAKIEMTAPVAQSGGGREIAMTAPVDQTRGTDGRWRVRFFMPAGSTLASLPTPNDKRVELVEVPGERVAALRYSGVASEDAVRDAQARLLAALKGSSAQPEGAPFSWFYDPPWTIPPLRRNEAVVRIGGPR